MKDRQDPDLEVQLPQGTDIVRVFDTIGQQDQSVPSSITLDSQNKETGNIIEAKKPNQIGPKNPRDLLVTSKK